MSTALLAFPDLGRFDALEPKRGEPWDSFVESMMGEARKRQDKGHLSAAAVYLEAAARPLHLEAIERAGGIPRPRRRRRVKKLGQKPAG